MIRFGTRLAIVAVLAVGVSGIAASAQPAGRRGAATGAEPGQAGTAAAGEESLPIPPETSSVTKHDWSAGGTTIHYTATAGNLLLRDDKDKANHSMFLRGVYGGWGGPEDAAGDVLL